jgi:hypothetical protein
MRGRFADPRRVVRNAGRGGSGTREVSDGQRPTSAAILGIRKPKSKERPPEKSEEAILPEIVETTELDRREGPLLQPCLAGR